MRVSWVDGLLGMGLGLMIIGVGMEYRTKISPRTEVVLERMEGQGNVLSIQDGPGPKAHTEADEDGPEAHEGRININEASREELEELPGIGVALAGRIIEYRQENDGFMNVEEIKLVAGIGEKLYEKIKDQIKI